MQYQYEEHDTDNTVNEDNGTKSWMSLRKKLKISFGSCMVTIVLLYVWKSFFGITFISGESMYPTLYDDDVLITQNISIKLDRLDRGDIISFVSNPDSNDELIYYIKRIIGIEGDRVAIYDGNVYVNNEKLEEEYLSSSIKTDLPGGSRLEVTLGEDEFFVLGDNRERSADSRYESIGAIKKENIHSVKLLKIKTGNKY